ncbi:hypothetical protein LTR62_004051 [Meristemomyces frigidus]|uniref:CSN8/PSMD8/EIF3K domain-containing protein n=1 Tax=Meristemomyces frigidus TaxID=1508187 RepID=A0AAN7TWM9_9PEZI|nr:hypothetical protein LTR62_004051 [Meristemomyces frigidus]
MASSNRPQARRGPSGAWTRLKPAVIDPLDVYGLPLHDHKTQELFFQKITDRYMKFIATSGGGEQLDKAFASLTVQPPPLTTSEPSNDKRGPSSDRPTLPRQPSTTPRPNDMPKILMAMRGLREGILGSQRRDRFAQRAYMFIIQASILSRHWESYQPALLYLLHEIHPATPLSSTDLQDFVGYRVLDLACRQYELMEAFVVQKAFGLDDRRVQAVVMCLVRDDWVRFWRSKRAVDGYQRAIMEFAVERMRVHALKCLGRGYMSADRGFVERSGGTSWAELVKAGVGWRLQDNGVVTIRTPKTK